MTRTRTPEETTGLRKEEHGADMTGKDSLKKQHHHADGEVAAIGATKDT